jgi:hypothetical protein
MAPLKKNNNMVTYVILAFVLVILLVLLFFLNKPMVKQQPVTTQPSQPTVVIVNKESSNTIPHFPQDLPKYGSSQYQQVGILTSEEADKEPIVLPLFGRKLENRSDRWQYYTATDKNNLMRIPLSYQNRDCEDDIGCSEIYSGDKLQVSIYQGRTFTATVYRTDAPKYFSSPY